MEVDGSSHELTAKYDQSRDRYSERWGSLALRIRACEVMQNLQGVVDLITETVRARPLRQR